MNSWGHWTFGDFTIIDLIAATTNAFNAALLVRRPDHWRHYTLVGIALLAVMGGIAGGVTRDVLLNDIPAPLTNPWYVIFCLGAAVVAVLLHFEAGQRFREGLFQFMTAFSLPWYAIVGASKAHDAHLPYIPAVFVGIAGATAGRFVIDLTSGVTPKLFVRGEWFVGTAVLAGALYLVAAAGFGWSIWPATLFAFGISFAFRLSAMLFGWEEPEPLEPPELTGDEPARTLLASKLAGQFRKQR